ncbi:MAG: trehalose-phosphatase [Planctomycetes bacterium]|nr:trehalose-phosphatase [Planctomycetota bacterium]
MKYLFTAAGRRLLESTTFTKTLYAFDFDGTLAKIVDHPKAARIGAKTRNLMRSLSRALPTAILSGRATEDLAPRLGFSPAYLIGNHGAEGLPMQRDQARLARAACSKWMEQIERSWRVVASIPGIVLEDKGYSIALHYRRSRTKKRARHALFELTQKLSPPPRLVLGKQVINIVPVGAPHKGVALLELMMHERASCALYVGDDDTDEDVFALPDARVITARVGARANSEAQFYLRRQSEVNRLLELLLSYHARNNGR